MITATLFPIPPDDPKLSALENALAITTVDAIKQPDSFTNVRPPWHPSLARGIFGGVVIAQCLLAAQATLPTNPNQARTRPSAAQPAGPSVAKTPQTEKPYLIHSLHTTFILSGSATTPIYYRVERTRDGRSFVTRTIRVEQKGQIIATATASFVREDSEGPDALVHEDRLPPDALAELERRLALHGPEAGARGQDGTESSGGILWTVRIPPVTVAGREARILTADKIATGFPARTSGSIVSAAGDAEKPIDANDRPRPQDLRYRQWMRATDRLSRGPDVDPTMHCAALAYSSDALLLGTVPRAHGLLRVPTDLTLPPAAETRLSTESQWSSSNSSSTSTSTSTSTSSSSSTSSSFPSSSSPLSNPTVRPASQTKAVINIAPSAEDAGLDMAMMASLTHTVHFHQPRLFRADDWFLLEKSTPQAGAGRGVVVERIWSFPSLSSPSTVSTSTPSTSSTPSPSSQMPRLVATVVQEGMVRVRRKGSYADLVIHNAKGTGKDTSSGRGRGHGNGNSDGKSEDKAEEERRDADERVRARLAKL